MKRSLYAFKAMLMVVLATLMFACVPSPAAAQNIGDFGENQIIDTVMRGQATTLGANIFVGLSTTACADSATGTEVAGGSYARASVARSLANWAGTQGAGTTVASSGTGGQTSNNTVITFATPSASWGLVSHVFLVDAAAGGNIIVCTALTLAKTINSGDAVTFPAGSLTFTVQ